MHRYNIIVENMISIFTVVDGNVKVLLAKKKEEPYKNYWVLPYSYLKNDEVLENNVNSLIINQTGLYGVKFEQDRVFSSLDRNPEARVIGVSYVGLIDITSAKLNSEEIDSYLAWFDIKNLPRLAYDHKEVVKSAIEYLKNRIVNIKILINFFPSDFTFPELQKVYEQILNKKLDRRNFRKKFINLGIIEDTGYKNEGASGRPAKLYRFKDNIEEINLF